MTDPSDEEWEAAFDAMHSMRRRESIAMTDVRSLVISDGGAPGGVQRARMGREFPIKSSVITTVLSNPLKRGIATAISWVNPRFFFCGPKDIRRALEHIDLGQEWEVLWPAFQELQKKLPPIEALALVVKALNEPAR